MWVADTSKAASQLLGARYGVPNLGDIRAVDWSAVSPVEVLVGGIPCQPYSIAGTQKGEQDERDLIPAFIEAVRVLRPKLIVVENVPGFRKGGLPRLVGALAEMGYDAQWTSVRADEAGAPHIRERTFVAATYANGQPWQQWRRKATRDQESRGAWSDTGGSSGVHALPTPTVALATGGQRSRSGTRKGEKLLSGIAIELLPTPNTGQSPNGHGMRGGAWGNGRQSGKDLTALAGSGHWGKYTAAIEQWEGVLGRTAPAPTEIGPKGNPRLAAPFVEWMMGLGRGWITDFAFHRGEIFTLLGNGVVPQQAARAIGELIDGWEEDCRVAA